jgi:hypothetical protein
LDELLLREVEGLGNGEDWLDGRAEGIAEDLEERELAGLLALVGGLACEGLVCGGAGGC